MNLLTFEERYAYLKLNPFVSPGDFLKDNFDDKREYLIGYIVYMHKKRPSRRDRESCSNYLNQCIALKLNLIDCINDFVNISNCIMNSGDFYKIISADLSLLTRLNNKQSILTHMNNMTGKFLYNNMPFNKTIFMDILADDLNLKFNIIKNLYCFYSNIHPDYIFNLMNDLNKLNSERLKTLKLTPCGATDETGIVVKDLEVYFKIYEHFGINFELEVIVSLKSRLNVPKKYLKKFMLDSYAVAPLSDINKQTNLRFRRRRAPVQTKKDVAGINITRDDIIEKLKDSRDGGGFEHENEYYKNKDIVLFVFENMDFSFKNKNVFNPPDVEINPNIKDLKNMAFLDYIKNNNLQIHEYFIADTKLSEILKVQLSAMIAIEKVMALLK